MLKLAGKVVVAVVVTLVAWEVLLRIFVVVPIPYHHDRALGWMPEPYSSGLYTLEGRGVCSYNEYGFRGGPVGEKKPGELRIVALGDSYTEAQQMDIEQTYPARLEQLLGARGGVGGGQSVRVLNGGRSASSPAYCVRLAEEYKQIFQPDWVVLLTNDGNWVNIFDPGKEIYLKPAGDALNLEVRWKWDTMSPLMKRLMRWRVRDLATFQYAYARFGTMQAARAKGAGGEGAGAGGQVEGRAGAKAPPAARLEKAVEWTVEQMSRLYPKLVVVHIPTGATVKGLGPKHPVEDLLVKSCASHGVPLIMMRDRITRDFAATNEPPYGFYNTLPWTGHLNAHGHALVARALYEFFDRELGEAGTAD
jgi:hypothetical protein